MTEPPQFSLLPGLDRQIRYVARRLADAVPGEIDRAWLAGDGEPRDSLDQLAKVLEEFSDEPLARLARRLPLSLFEAHVVLLAMLPELDPRLGPMLQQIASDVVPTFGLTSRILLGGGGLGAEARHLLARSALWWSGLLVGSEPPSLARTLRPTAAALECLEKRLPVRLSGGAPLRLIEPDAAPNLHLALRFQPRLTAEIDELLDWRAATGTSVLLLTAERSEQAETFAGALALRLGSSLITIDTVSVDTSAIREACLAAWLAGAVLHIHVKEPAQLPDELLLPRLLIVSAAASVTLRCPSSLPHRRLTAPLPTPADQLGLWRHLHAQGEPATNDNEAPATTTEAPTSTPENSPSSATPPTWIRMVANQTRLLPAEIARILEIARLHAGVAPLDQAHIAQALAEVVPEPVSTLARTSRPNVAWSGLVLPPGTQATLDRVLTHLEHRAQVQTLGVMGPREAGRGLVALFHGQSGTGKTLAAEAIATRLSLPLMAIDLSRVVSKYIGETEKNLSELFDVAEGFRAVLFFDEADALFTARTKVSDAHDRYANIETNFMLQRLEGFDGLAILASNLPQNLDKAFARRIDFKVLFPSPAVDERLRLWELHLPLPIRSEDLDLAVLAATFDLVGGEIRRAAIDAAFAATAASSDAPCVTAAVARRSIKDLLIANGRMLSTQEKHL